MKKTRKTKQIAAFAAAVVMAACTAMPMSMMSASAAASENTITFTKTTGGADSSETATTHTYAAYKIFTGTATSNGFGGSAELKNTDWALSTDNAASFLAALQEDSRFNTTTTTSSEENPDEEVSETTNDFAGCSTAASVAKVLAGYNSDSEKAKAFAEFAVSELKTLNVSATATGTGSLTVESDGYYVIEETAVSGGDGTGTMTAYLLGVYDASAGAEIEVKSDLPSFQKKIQDTNDSDSTVTDNTGWTDSADYDIGDDVPFQLTATLPSDYATYKKYKLVFHDNLEDDVFASSTVSNIKYYYQKSGSDTKVEITGGTSSSTSVNSADSNFASTHGDNTCNLEFTIADLKTATFDGTNINPAAGDKIIVEYTAKLGADAKLGSTGNWNSGYLEYSNNPYYAGGAGETETTSKTPEDQVVAFTYQLDVSKVDASGNALAGAGFTLYKYVLGAKADTSDKNITNDATDTNGAYVKVAEIAAGTDTTFTFKGIDDGVYKLVETEIPNGFNKADDVDFTVSATHSEESDAPILISLSTTKDSITVDKSASTAANASDGYVYSGKLQTKVENKSGATLPSTGGIGTTVFYVTGGVLVAGAGVLLITKKRTKKDDAE
jgi:fimbrial isopeptide formation D2 family protein/LPXTG-motif cell wall-anchored protein